MGHFLVQHSSGVRPTANGISRARELGQGKLEPHRQHLPFTGCLRRIADGPQFTVARHRQQSSAEAPRRPASARDTKSGAEHKSYRSSKEGSNYKVDKIFVRRVTVLACHGPVHRKVSWGSSGLGTTIQLQRNTRTESCLD